MWTAQSDRDYYGSGDGREDPLNDEGDAWNDLSADEYSLFMTDPGFGPGDPLDAESDIEQRRCAGGGRDVPGCFYGAGLRGGWCVRGVRNFAAGKGLKVLRPA